MVLWHNNRYHVRFFFDFFQKFSKKQKNRESIKPQNLRNKCFLIKSSQIEYKDGCRIYPE